MSTSGFQSGMRQHFVRQPGAARSPGSSTPTPTPPPVVTKPQPEFGDPDLPIPVTDLTYPFQFVSLDKFPEYEIRESIYATFHLQSGPTPGTQGPLRVRTRFHVAETAAYLEVDESVIRDRLARFGGRWAVEMTNDFGTQTRWIGSYDPYATVVEADLASAFTMNAGWTYIQLESLRHGIGTS